MDVLFSVAIGLVAVVIAGGATCYALGAIFTEKKYEVLLGKAENRLNTALWSEALATRKMLRIARNADRLSRIELVFAVGRLQNVWTKEFRAKQAEQIDLQRDMEARMASENH